MTDDKQAPTTILRNLITGYQVTQAIYVAASLSIADLLAEKPRSADELAGVTHTDPESLYRLLRALASVGVFEENEGRRFSLTAVGECLRSDSPESMRNWATYAGRPYHWQAWSGLFDSVKTGENAFQRMNGMSIIEYRATSPVENQIFDGAMTDQSVHVNRALLDSYDFSTFGTVVDVGGGQGALLAALLAKYPKMRGILFDQPQVVTAARRRLDTAKVGDRCEIVGGSFFEEITPGGDAYLLKSVLEDWNDDDSMRILRQCRRVISPTGVLLVIETVIGPPNQGRIAKFSDLNMLVGPGGRNRTIEEYRALLAAAGFRLVYSTPTTCGPRILCACV